MNNKVFHIYENCVESRGYRRSLMMDLQRNDVHPIPHALGDVIIAYKNNRQSKTIDAIVADADNINLEYLDFLINNEIGNWLPISFVNQLPKIDFNWDHPGEVNDGIIELSVHNMDGIGHLINEMCSSGMRHAYFLIPHCSVTIIRELFKLLHRTAIKCFNASIAIENKEMDAIRELLGSEVRTGQVHALSKSGSAFKDITMLRNLFNRPPIRSSMIVNIRYYSECLQFNPAFNRRVWLSEDLKFNFGTPDGPGFEKLIELFIEGNNRIGRVTKEKVDVCADCEFKRACYDTRTPVSRVGDKWYHTSECNYNPYICKWNDEEDYRTLAECGVVSNAEGFTIDHERIAAINAELWGE